MLEHEDYLPSLSKVREKRNQRLDPRRLVLLLVAVAVVGAIALGIKPIKKPVFDKVTGPASAGQVGDAAPAQADPTGVSPEEETAQKEAQEINSVISPYNNLGITQMFGYLDIREIPSTDGKTMGKLSGDGVREILAMKGGWSHITSSGVEDYISNQYLLIGSRAREKAKELVKLRATATVDNLNTRQAPTLDPGNVIEQVLKGERYVIKGLEDDWIQVGGEYISSEYAEVAYSLNEERKIDMKAMIINQCDNLVVSKMNNYLNVRREPESDDKIVDKMTNKAAGGILETPDGWYKIKSGPIIGYISIGPQYTVIDQEAKDIAMQNATFKAVVNTDVLSVRMGPNTEARIWTQIVKDEYYPVVAQLGGWVEIDLDSVDEEGGDRVDKASISTGDNNVEVRYAPNEAIKFSPAEVVANSAASRRSKVVNYVLQFMGNSYAWGGTGLTEDVDCSGPTMQVMKQFGMSLPHYSDSQAKMGKAIAFGNMRLGDLIFYVGSSGQVNHVAIYIGSGQVVYAASHESGIEVSTWNYRSPVAIRNALGD